MIAQHSSESNEQFTPAPIVEAARTVLGGIDLDPASCAMAQETVKATKWYGPGSPWIQDGLGTSWEGRVFLNPPGGRVPPEHQRKGTASFAALWWHQLVRDWEEDRTKSAIFMGFTLEILRSTQVFPASAMDFPFCVPRKRTEFGTINRIRTKGKRAGQLIDPTAPIGARVVGTDPSHANVIVYLPPGRNDDPSCFADVFSEFGRVKI